VDGNSTCLTFLEQDRCLTLLRRLNRKERKEWARRLHPVVARRIACVAFTGFPVNQIQREWTRELIKIDRPRLKVQCYTSSSLKFGRKNRTYVTKRHGKSKVTCNHDLDPAYPHFSAVKAQWTVLSKSN